MDVPRTGVEGGADGKNVLDVTGMSILRLTPATPHTQRNTTTETENKLIPATHTASLVSSDVALLLPIVSFLVRNILKIISMICSLSASQSSN